MPKALTLNEGAFAKLLLLKNRNESFKNCKFLTWGQFSEKVSEDNILIPSRKFYKKLPKMLFKDVIVFQPGGFMSVDEDLKFFRRMLVDTKSNIEKMKEES